MKKPHAWFILSCLLLSFLLAVSGCQKSDQAAPQPAATAAPPPPPPPPPETSQGTLVKVERADKTMVRVVYLTTAGLAQDTQEEKAGKGKTFVVLHFEGKGKSAKTWLTDGTGKKYTEGMWYAPKRVKGQKEKAQVSYEIPADATGLVWHDAKQPYKLEPVVVALPPEQEKAPATGKQ